MRDARHGIGATLVREMLDALDADPALRERARTLLAELAPESMAGAEFVDRHGAGLGPTEWHNATREIDTFLVGRRLLARAADLRRWIEARQVDREGRHQEADLEAHRARPDEPDEFDRALTAGRLVVLRGGDDEDGR